MNRVIAEISLPPTSLVLLSIASMHCGAAFAKMLFPELGAAGTVLMRIGFAAIVLFLLRRPAWTTQTQQHFKTLASFGIVLALMNLAFYESIERIPLGIAATLEFTGPLGLAALRSRKWLEMLWVGLAALGVLLLAPIGGIALDSWGITFALIAAFFLALYIVLSARVGQAIPGIDGLIWAMAIAAALIAPIGIALAGSALLQPRLLLLGLGVAILSSTVPYSLELIALRSIPISIFGVLRSLEPMSASIAGFVVLRETLTLRALLNQSMKRFSETLKPHSEICKIILLFSNATLRSILAIGLISLSAAGASRFRGKTQSG